MEGGVAPTPAPPKEEKKEKQVLGHYELGKALGKGSFSSVRECVDIHTGKAYAMKILDKKQLQSQNMGSQVNREIAVMLKMAHRNVCNMRECFQTQDKVYIVLELVKGGDLFERVKREKRLEENAARDFFQQLILGLNYCHKNKVAHRDLKPENLLINEEGILKISDFGLSNSQQCTGSGRVNPSMMLNTVCGTPNYVAPEVLLEKGYNGFQADMWSAGVILYVMLAGKLPFYDKVMAVLFKKIQTGSYAIPEYFTPDVVALLKKLICVDPDKRATVEQVIQDPWFRIGWKDEWLNEGELVRSQSQEHINQSIAQLREQRQKAEASSGRRSSGTTPPATPPKQSTPPLKPGTPPPIPPRGTTPPLPVPSAASIGSSSSATTSTTTSASSSHERSEISVSTSGGSSGGSGTPTPTNRPAPKVKKPRPGVEDGGSSTPPAETAWAPSAFAESIKNFHAQKPGGAPKPGSTEDSIEAKKKELEDLARQKAEMDRLLEERKRELASLNLHH